MHLSSIWFTIVIIQHKPIFFVVLNLELGTIRWEKLPQLVLGNSILGPK